MPRPAPRRLHALRATRYDKLAVHDEATVLVAAINEWLCPRTSYAGIHVPCGRKTAAAEDADEVVLAHDVELLAVGASPENDLVGEAGGPPKFYVVQSVSDCRPRGDVRAVSGGLVADLAHSPPALIAHEADLACTQNHVPAGTGHVLASPRRQPKHTVRADHEVNGSVSSAADRSAIQPPKSAAEPMRHPPLPGRTAAFSSTGPTYL